MYKSRYILGTQNKLTKKYVYSRSTIKLRVINLTASYPKFNMTHVRKDSTT